MSMFDSIIDSAKDRLGIGGDSAGSIFAALVSYATAPENGGFSGFLDKFRSAGLGSAVDSWVNDGDGDPLTDEQVHAALGGEAIDSIAASAGVDSKTATAAVGGMIPQLVDDLTPDAEIPDNDSVFSKIGGWLSNWGGALIGGAAAVAGGAAALAGGAADKVGDAAGATYDKGKEILGSGVGAVGAVAGGASAMAGDAAGAVGDAAGATFDKGKEMLGSGLGAVKGVGDSLDGSGGGGMLKWLLLAALLAIVAFLGYKFCGPSTKPVANTNTNTARATNANANAATTNVNTNANANTATVTAAPDAMTEVTLPNGTKLQAHVGGIEDQLVKFISSPEYKGMAGDLLKDKWFNFDDLNFKFGTTELAPESKRQLDNIAAILKAFPEVKIKIGGYTDKKGDDAANLKLSDGRAKAVQAALKKDGVGDQVPEAEGYGEKFATVDEAASDDARKADRKTAVRLIK